MGQDPTHNKYKADRGIPFGPCGTPRPKARQTVLGPFRNPPASFIPIDVFLFF